MLDQVYLNPEPVPAASQLAVLPFLAAVHGYLSEEREIPGLRMTMHRAMSRQGEGYLQQVCAYVRYSDLEGGQKVGRTFAVNYGIMGAAFGTRQIWRTKEFANEEKLRRDLATAVERVRDGLDPEQIAVSYLAIPFLSAENKVILILYMECKEPNFFADDKRLSAVVAMCRGFVKVFDWLQGSPFPRLKNFPLTEGTPVEGNPTVYEELQEPVLTIPPPRFADLNSFNYEAAIG